MPGREMTEQEMVNFSGDIESPGGFVFGVQGWTWGEQHPTSITFLLNGTASVQDQHGRPIKGTVTDGRPCYFAKCSHAQTVAALAAEGIDWRKLVCAGWPQLPYDQLKGLKELPPTPIEELRKIREPQLRKDALRARRERDAEKRENEEPVEEDEL